MPQALPHDGEEISLLRHVCTGTEDRAGHSHRSESGNGRREWLSFPDQPSRRMLMQPLLQVGPLGLARYDVGLPVHGLQAQMAEAWRGENALCLPQFPQAQVDEIRDTISYPPVGSAMADSQA